MSTNYDAIKQAIEQKLTISAVYDGYPREMCPHALGLKGGIMHVLSFQFAGESSRGLPPGGEWKCMRVDGLSINNVKSGPWRTSSSHTKRQTCIDNVQVEVTY